MISFVISSFNKPLPLVTCVTSLLAQTRESEVIVCDNTPPSGVKEEIQKYMSLWHTDTRFKYVDTSKECPPHINAGYAAQNIGAKQATGEWLCFPSEDCYYVPGFAEVMLESAKEFNWDFVYCDFLFDPRYNGIASKGTYSVVGSTPRFRFIDKSNFIVKRELFKCFDIKEDNFINKHGYADYGLVEKLIKKGIKHGHAPGVLCVHN